ncbi:MAG: hypothetical protein J5379_00505 [Clostridiales bacterium]|nr:hypothetical protein [Clostridiales bacterium]
MSILDTPWVAIGLMIVCAIADGMNFYSLFSTLSNDSALMVIVSCVGLLIGFDVSPILLGSVYKKAEQGYKKEWGIILFCAAATAICFSIYVYTRIAAKDLMLSGEVSTSQMGALETEPQADPLALASAICWALLPIATSFVSFGASCHAANPMRKEKQVLEDNLLILDNAIDRDEAILKELEEDPQDMEQAMREEEELFKVALRRVVEIAREDADYVRERIKEHVTGANEINRLSMPVYEEVAKLLDDNSSEETIMRVLLDATEKVRLKEKDIPDTPEKPEGRNYRIVDHEQLKMWRKDS